MYVSEIEDPGLTEWLEHGEGPYVHTEPTWDATYTLLKVEMDDRFSTILMTSTAAAHNGHANVYDEPPTIRGGLLDLKGDEEMGPVIYDPAHALKLACFGKKAWSMVDRDDHELEPMRSLVAARAIEAMGSRGELDLLDQSGWMSRVGASTLEELARTQDGWSRWDQNPGSNPGGAPLEPHPMATRVTTLDVIGFMEDDAHALSQVAQRWLHDEGALELAARVKLACLATVGVEQAAWAVDLGGGRQAVAEVHLTEEDESPTGQGFYFAGFTYEPDEGRWVEHDGGLFWGYRCADDPELMFEAICSCGPVTDPARAVRVDWQALEDAGVWDEEGRPLTSSELSCGDVPKRLEALADGPEDEPAPWRTLMEGSVLFERADVDSTMLEEAASMESEWMQIALEEIDGIAGEASPDGWIIAARSFPEGGILPIDCHESSFDLFERGGALHGHEVARIQVAGGEIVIDSISETGTPVETRLRVASPAQVEAFETIGDEDVSVREAATIAARVWESSAKICPESEPVRPVREAPRRGPKP